MVAWLEATRESLDLALYDVRLPGAVGDDVGGATRGAATAACGSGSCSTRTSGRKSRGRSSRRRRVPSRRCSSSWGCPLKPIPGWRDLMHHQYAVRDGAAVWTGSANWTLDNWTRAENVLATVASPRARGRLARDFEQMWPRGRVDDRDGFDAPGHPWATPACAPGSARRARLSHRIAKRIGAARRRVRIASPVLTAGPILGTLNEVLAEGRLDVAGVCDATQIARSSTSGRTTRARPGRRRCWSRR